MYFNYIIKLSTVLMDDLQKIMQMIYALEDKPRFITLIGIDPIQFLFLHLKIQRQRMGSYVVGIK